MLRKAAWAAVGIIPTLIAANLMPRFVLYVFSLIVLIATGIFFFYRRKGKCIRTFFLLCAATVGLCSFLIQHEATAIPLRRYDQQTVQVKAVFVDGADNHWSAKIIDAYNQNGDPIRVRGTIPVAVYDRIIEKYDEGIIEFTVNIDTESEQLVPTDVQVLSVHHPYKLSLREKMDRFRQQVITLLKVRIGGEEGNLAAAFLTGDKTDLARQTTIDFRRTGMTHVMAVSGLHLSIFIGMISYLLSRIEANRKLISIISLLFVGLVIILGGFSTSVLRAGIMSAVLFIGYLLNRNADPINSLGLALSILALLFPTAVITPSYLLSGSATAGILILSPILDHKLFGKWFVTRNQRKQLSLISVSLSSSIFTAPILILFFGEFSLLSVPVMSLVNYPVTLVLLGSILLCCFSRIPFLGDFIAFILRLVARFILDIVELFAQFDQATLSFHSVPIIIFAVLCLLLVLTLWLLQKRQGLRHLLSGCLVLFMALSLMGAQQYPQLFSKFFILSSAPGGCNIYMDDGKSVVIDCANSSLAANAQKTLAQHGFTYIDLLLVTDLKIHMSGGIPTLLANMPAKQVVIIGNNRYNEQFLEIVDAANSAGADVLLLNDDMTLTINSLYIRLYDLNTTDSNYAVIMETDEQSIGFFSSLDHQILAKSVHLPHGTIHVNTLVLGADIKKDTLSAPFLYATQPQNILALSTTRHVQGFTLNEIKAIHDADAKFQMIGENQTYMMNYHQIG